MGWRRLLCVAMVWQATAAVAAAVELPSGPCVVDFTLTRTGADAWCELTLAAADHATTRVGLSTKRASLSCSTNGDQAVDGGRLPAKGASTAYRLLRTDDYVAVEREGLVVIAGYAAAAGATSVDAKTSGCEIRWADAQPTEPPYFSDDFLRTDDEDGGWLTIRGKWHIGEYRDKLVAALKLAPQATWYECADSGLALAGSPWWRDVEVAATLRGTSPAGVVFAAQGQGFGLFRLRAGQAELVLAAGGRETVLGATPYTPEAGRWVRLSVISSRGRAVASINGVRLLNVAMPTLGSGQVGLWAGGPAQFDDFLVTERALAWDAVAKQQLDGRLWRTNSPTRSRLAPFDSGRITAVANLARDGVAGLTMTAAPALALDVTRRGAKQRYSFRVGTDEVAAGDLADTPDHRHPITIRRRGPLFEALVDGRQVGLTGQADAPPSTAGVAAGGLLTEVEVWSEPDAPDALIHRADFTPLREDWVGRDESERTIPDIWRPEQGRWRIRDDSLIGQADDQPARLWYRDALPADTGLAANIEELSPGASFTLVAGGGAGLRLEVSAQQALLTRDGVEKARLALSAAPTSVRLYRDGAWVVGDVDDQHLVWRDPQPTAAGQLFLRLSPRGRVVLSGAEVLGRNGFASSFGEVDTQWREDGDWQWTSGMACIAWSYWLTGDGRDKPSWLWRRTPLGHDVTVAFQVGEHTDGYDQGNETHQHFPYHDVSLMLDGNGKDPDSGYRFVIGENHGRGVRLYRAGRPVAFDDGLRITMGDHCNDPRAIRVLATRSGSRVTITCNGRQTIAWDAPQPLVGGGIVGLGVKYCRANFHDLVALRYRD